VVTTPNNYNAAIALWADPTIRNRFNAKDVNPDDSCNKSMRIPCLLFFEAALPVKLRARVTVNNNYIVERYNNAIKIVTAFIKQGILMATC
jgi:hypothetical protein